VVEVGWTSAAERVKGNDSHLEQYPLTYWQPVEHVAKNWCNVLKIVSTDHQPDSSVENHRIHPAQVPQIMYWQDPTPLELLLLQ